MITIYGAPWCGWCEKAKALATRYHLHFTYNNVDFPEIKAELAERFQDGPPKQKLTIPQIWWDGRYVGGYDHFASEIENLRNKAQGPC
jgi:glutaredoxin